jgi:hypothetical protein
MPGAEKSRIPAPNGNGIINTIECMNEACKWYETTWVVQVDRNGEIPDQTKMAPARPRPKLRGTFTEENMERVRDQLRRQTEQSREN